MHLPDIAHSQFPAMPGRDPIRAAEEDIRRYLIQHGVLKYPVPVAPGNGRTLLCFLAIYAAIAMVVLVGSFCLTRLECDPMFTDRGLSGACRYRAGALTKIFGSAGNGYAAFMPSNMAQ
jgi:hypothetical protein